MDQGVGSAERAELTQGFLKIKQPSTSAQGARRDEAQQGVLGLVL